MKKSLFSLIAASLFTVASAAPWAPTIVVSPGDPVCNAQGTGATVGVDFAVTSQSASYGTLYYIVNGGTAVALPGIPDGNVADNGGWTFVAKSKTYASDFLLTLANGSYSVQVCIAQPGAAHLSCDTKAVVVACQSADPCASVGFFGSLPANKNLCQGQGNIEIQFQGSFGPTATLYIYDTQISATEPFKTVSVTRSGESCNYHYNWDPQADGAQAGAYRFDVGAQTFSATLVCDRPGPNQ